MTATQKSIIFDKDTKISRLLQTDDRMMELVQSISPVFAKLSNPLLRKSVAPRVRIRDAARIAGITPNEFLKKLEQAGYSVRYDETESLEVVPKHCDRLKNYRIRRFDARPVLERGDDPFDAIRRQLQELAPDEALEIVLDFEPLPLIEIFSRSGYIHCTRCDKDGTVHTWFFKPLPKTGFWDKLKSFFGLPVAGNPSQEIAPGNASRQVPVHDAGVHDRMMEKYRDHIRHIDVRGLEMPQPMMQILEQLEQLKPGEALSVDHERIPQYLLPELADRHMEIAARKTPDGKVHLIIYPKSES